MKNKIFIATTLLPLLVSMTYSGFYSDVYYDHYFDYSGFNLLSRGSTTEYIFNNDNQPNIGKVESFYELWEIEPYSAYIVQGNIYQINARTRITFFPDATYKCGLFNWFVGTEPFTSVSIVNIEYDLHGVSLDNIIYDDYNSVNPNGGYTFVSIKNSAYSEHHEEIYFHSYDNTGYRYLSYQKYYPYNSTTRPIMAQLVTLYNSDKFIEDYICSRTTTRDYDLSLNKRTRYLTSSNLKTIKVSGNNFTESSGVGIYNSDTGTRNLRTIDFYFSIAFKDCL